MRKRFDHETPYWVRPERTYFITICAQDRKPNTFCHPTIGKTILDSARLRNERKIWL
jgi:hypothetical protein